jgi:hypothetical protein
MKSPSLPLCERGKLLITTFPKGEILFFSNLVRNETASKSRSLVLPIKKYFLSPQELAPFLIRGRGDINK